VGQFTQEDPIGLAGGLNLYGYANGDPVNFSDPFGLCVGPATALAPLCLRAAVFILGRAGPAIAAAGAASTGLSTSAPRVVGGAGAGVRATGHVYRGLAPADNTAVGLVARAPGAGNTPISHVAGQRTSQWISTTKSPEIADQVFGQYGVVSIDLSKVTTEVVDVSNGFPGMPGMLSNWARKFQEVLIKDQVPPEAITRIK
jgi:uncharacterized protein RhaS with RHS repeats